MLVSEEMIMARKDFFLMCCIVNLLGVLLYSLKENHSSRDMFVMTSKKAMTSHRSMNFVTSFLFQDISENRFPPVSTRIDNTPHRVSISRVKRWELEIFCLLLQKRYVVL